MEDVAKVLARFKAGIRADIRKEMFRQPVYSVKYALQVALDVEECFKQLITKKIWGPLQVDSFRKMF